MDRKKQSPGLLEIFLLVISLIATIAVIIIQIINSSRPLSQLETSLFSVTQFIFSILFGWLITRLVTKNEYYENLKDYGLSAYRRIRDIKRSLFRLRNVITENRDKYPKEKTHELDILLKIVDDVDDTVVSSIADWGSIIGSEVKKAETIETLEDQLHQVYATGNLQTISNGERNLEIQKIRSEIANLNAGLPPELQVNLDTEFKFPYSTKVYEELASQLEKFNEYRLLTNIRVPFTIGPCHYSEGEAIEVILVYICQNDGIQSIEVRNPQGYTLGQVINSEVNESVTEQEYIGSVYVDLFQQGQNPSVPLGKLVTSEKGKTAIVVASLENIGGRG